MYFRCLLKTTLSLGSSETASEQSELVSYCPGEELRNRENFLILGLFAEFTEKSLMACPGSSQDVVSFLVSKIQHAIWMG